MGGTQYVRIEPNSIPRHYFHMVAGVLFSNILFLKYLLCNRMSYLG